MNVSAAQFNAISCPDNGTGAKSCDQGGGRPKRADFQKDLRRRRRAQPEQRPDPVQINAYCARPLRQKKLAVIPPTAA